MKEYVLLARGLTTAPATGESNVTKPGSAATITLFTNVVNNASTRSCSRYKRTILWLNSSADSGASGVIYEESLDGTNFRTVSLQTYATANGVTRYFVECVAPFFRWRYTNSAAVLTTWEMAAWGDPHERMA